LLNHQRPHVDRGGLSEAPEVRKIVRDLSPNVDIDLAPRLRQSNSWNNRVSPSRRLLHAGGCLSTLSSQTRRSGRSRLGMPLFRRNSQKEGKSGAGDDKEGHSLLGRLMRRHSDQKDNLDTSPPHAVRFQSLAYPRLHSTCIEGCWAHANGRQQRPSRPPCHRTRSQPSRSGTKRAAILPPAAV
jgi:hypothetical protein